MFRIWKGLSFTPIRQMLCKHWHGDGNWFKKAKESAVQRVCKIHLVDSLGIISVEFAVGDIRDQTSDIRSNPFFQICYHLLAMLQTCHNSTSRVVAKAQAAALRNFTQAKIKLRISLSGFPSSPLRFFGDCLIKGSSLCFPSNIYSEISERENSGGHTSHTTQTSKSDIPKYTILSKQSIFTKSHESHVDIPFIGKKLSPHPIHQLRLGHPYGPMAKSMSPWNGHHGMHVMKSTSNEPMAGGGRWLV